MHADEVSLLSDDFRPRDTPNHTLLKDFNLNPLVPDLSIVEAPSGELASHNRCQQPVINLENSHPGVSNRQNPLVEECKTYSEWRKKSAQQSKPLPSVNRNHEYAYAHFVNGCSSPTVLDNLSPSADLQSSDGNSSTSVNGRVNHTTSPVCRKNLKVSHSSPRTVSQKSWETSTASSNTHKPESHCMVGREIVAQGIDSHTDLGGRKPQVGNSNYNNVDHGSRQVVNYQSEVSNCVGCAHWLHQPMSAVNCHVAPVYSSYPHKSMPSCNPLQQSSMPLPPSSGLPANRIDLYPTSNNGLTNPGPSLAFSDSVVYDNLYQIVLSQSEQLKLLQTQVEKLLISQENHSCIGSPRSRGGNQNRLSTTAMEKGTQTSDNEVERDECTKMSIGVMTTSLTHTVAYAGRVGHVDTRNRVLNQPTRYTGVESRHKVQNGNSQSTSTSPSSQALLSSSSCSRSDLPSSPISGTQNNCCNHPDCISNKKKKQRVARSSKPDKVTQMDQLVEDLGNKVPGVSAAIRTVRGCQAALQSQSLPDEADLGRSDLATGANESLTLNGAEIPRYSSLVEQRVTPPPSLHLVVEEYSDQDGSYSDDESSSSSDSGESDSQHQDLPNGWTTHTNNPVKENNYRESKDCGDRDYRIDRSAGRNKKSRKENRPPHSVANIVQKRVSFQHEPKYPKENPGDDFKAVALKFLRDNYPEELNSSACLPDSKSHKRVNEMATYGRKNNMSYATFDYLRRYDLLPEADYKNTRIEELPGYGVEVPATTTSSPSRERFGYVTSYLEQQVNAEQYGIRTVNGRDLVTKDHVGRPVLREKQISTRPESRKRTPKRRHKHYPQTDSAVISQPNAHQSSPLYNVLDMTALYDQDKLPCNM